jgi:hypothetical protein
VVNNVTRELRKHKTNAATRAHVSANVKSAAAICRKKWEADLAWNSHAAVWRDLETDINSAVTGVGGGFVRGAVSTIGGTKFT